jgi:hypothetical protein
MVAVCSAILPVNCGFLFLSAKTGHCDCTLFTRSSIIIFPKELFGQFSISKRVFTVL